MFVSSGSKHHITKQNEESKEDADHLSGVFLWLNPYLMKEIQSAKHFHRNPEHHYCCYRHTDVCAPSGELQLLLEDKETAEKASRCDDACHGMMVADEILVVAKHQEKIAGPQYHIEFHEGNDTGMMRHRARCNLVLS